MTWKDETDFQSVDELFKRFVGLGRRVAWRGQADSSWFLRASLDRMLDPNSEYTQRLNEECAVLNRFRTQAREYLGSLEGLRVNQNDKISALTVLQHYRAPTRLLDWTASAWVALYFAAVHRHDKDGAVWWFDREAFYDEVGKRWEKYGLKHHRHRNNQVDLNETAFDRDGPAWITELNCTVPFHRIEVQQAFFTVAGRLGREHGELIADVLDKGKYGRIVVRASWKQDILDGLRNMNINSKSLDYPGADLVGIGLTRELKRN